MKNNIRPLLFLLLVLAAVALAAGPRIALVKITSGSARLDGQPIKKAAMATEGQLLEVEAGSRVLVQLLGSSGELTLDGPDRLSLKKAELAKRSSKTERGAVEVTRDIGNLHVSGAGAVRRGTVETYALRPLLPPEKSEDGWLIRFGSGEDLVIPEGYSLTYSIGRDRSIVAEGELTGEVRPIRLKSTAIVPGENYLFELILFRHSHREAFASQTFRLLTPEDDELLSAARADLLDRYRQQRDVLPLLRLASLYADFGQLKETLKYLEQARKSPYLRSASVRRQLEKDVSALETALEARLPLVRANP